MPGPAPDADLEPRALSRPFVIRGHRFRNRLVMAPMCAMYAAPDGGVTRQMIEYYRARARGGAALVIVEITFMDDAGSRAFHAQPGAHSDAMIPGLNELAEAIKGEGAVAGLQLGHCGAQRVIMEPPVVAPSPLPWAPGKRVPHELTIAEIEQLVADHVDAARRLAQAGFDLVELHGAHGYLINEFLCPAINRRSDDYGGSAANRLRFPLAVVKGVRAALGDKRLLSFRINGDDLLPGGLGIDDYRDIARVLADAGVDMLHVSAGTYQAMEQRIAPMYLAEGPFVRFVDPIRRAARRPVIASGSIHDLAAAEALVRDGNTDFVSMARPLFADADLPRKLLAGHDADILPCIRCNTCVSREQSGARALCAINPRTGEEWIVPPPAGVKRSVVVLGGGPAGIQAALSAAERGHRVTLIERESEIGGKVAIAARLPFKRTLPRLLAYWRRALIAARVDVLLGSELPTAPAADTLIVATGSEAGLPESARSSVIVVADVARALRTIDRLGPRVLVVGATTAGLETAWHLADLGRRVEVIERGADLDDDVNLVSRIVFTEALARRDVAVSLRTELAAIEAGNALVRRDDVVKRLTVDAIVLASGAAPRIPSAAEAWRQAGADVRFIGECAGQIGLLGATRSAHRVSVSL